MTAPEDVASPSQRRQARALVNAVASRGRLLTGRESKAVLALYGIRTARETLAASFEEAVIAAEEIGYPVVLKAEAPGLVGKTEAGAIMLDVADEATLRRCFKRVLTNAWGAVPAFTVGGVLVQETVPGSTELSVRMHQEEHADAMPPEFLLRFSALCRDLGDLVQEIEVDPLIVDGDSACAVDCVIVPA